MKKKNRVFKYLLFIGGSVLLASLVFLSRFASASLNGQLLLLSPEDYAVQALKRIEDYGLYANGAEWAAVYEWALTASRGCSTYADAYTIIEQALAVGGGKHSYLQPAEDKTAGDTAETDSLPQVSLEESIAIIQLPAFTGEGEKATCYAQTVQDFLHANRSKIRGVLLDLRGNTGGDLGPMLSAVASLLPDDVLLTYCYRSVEVPVTLKAGVLQNAGSGGYGSCLKEKGVVPVAVVVDGKTASSAEALMLCFRGQKQTRSFGCATAGYTSANMTYTLYDGAQMALTVAAIKTSTGDMFENIPVIPDETSATPLDDAKAWLWSARHAPQP